MHIFKRVMNDEMIKNIQQGDQQAFAKLYDTYSSNLYGLAYSILGDEEIAADVLQMSFVKIWRKITTFDQNRGSIFTWMLNITRNTAIDEYRKINRQLDNKERFRSEPSSSSFSRTIRSPE